MGSDPSRFKSLRYLESGIDFKRKVLLALPFSPAEASNNEPDQQSIRELHVLRRDFGIGMMSTVFARHAVAAIELDGGPPLHAFKRERARIYLLGFGEAKDESWATPQVHRAFRESSD